MNRYWVSCIIQDREDSVPWLCACTESNVSLESAMELVEKYKRNFRVISIWIDCYNDADEKSIVYHEACVSVIGKPKKKTVNIEVGCWKYNNSDFKVTKESEYKTAVIEGETIEDAMNAYQARRVNHDCAKYTPMSINNITMK